jgi:hypothetical protein
VIDFKRLGDRAKREPPRVPGLTIAVTGHRPDKLWHRREQVGGVTVSHDGYEWGNPLRQRLRAEVRDATEALVAKAKRHRFDAEYRDSYLVRVRWQNGWGDGEPGAERWRSIEVLTLSGGALGVDQDAAGEWRRMDLPYVVVQPFPGQDSRWPRRRGLPTRRSWTQPRACTASLSTTGRWAATTRGPCCSCTTRSCSA